MSGALDGVVVVDLTEGMAGPLASMWLADHGAEVWKIEPPAGDRARSEPGFHLWNRGKRSVVLDLLDDGDRAEAFERCTAADVVLDERYWGRPVDGLLDPHELLAAAPGLVHCTIDGFAVPHLDVLPVRDEGILSALTGRMVGLDHLSGAIDDQDRAAPIYTAVPTATFGAAALACQAVLAGLLRRGRTGAGAVVRTSLLQGAETFLMRQEMARGEVDASLRISEAAHRGIELCFLTARCKDGRYIQMCARQDHHFRSWLTALGMADALDDPTYAKAPMGIARVADVVALEQRIRARMAERTQDEWMHTFIHEVDVGADPFLTPSEFLEHEQMLANDRIVVIDDPELGPVRQLGALVASEQSPAVIERPAPRLNADAGNRPTVRSAERRFEGTAPKAPMAPERLLEGVTIIEAAYFIAGPLAASILAELGARVIKVEPVDGDPYRRTGLQSVKFLHGKESIALDLKDPKGTEALHALVARADAFVHSFRPGVDQRLHLDAATLLGINPRLVHLYAGSYGSKGPQAHRSAFHSTPTALTGGGILQAGEGNVPVDDSYPDPGSALGAAIALLMGLTARDRTGQGQVLETSMLASSAFILSGEMVSYAGKPPWRLPDRGQHGIGDRRRLYRGADGWLFVAAEDDLSWAAVAEVLEGAADVEAAFAARPVGPTVVALQARGVSATIASDVELDRWLEAEGLLIPASHPFYGEYWRTRPKIDVEGIEPVLAPPTTVGEHTQALLSELGLANHL